MSMDKVMDMNLLISLERVCEGMILGADVLDKEGRLLVTKDTMISSIIIDKLRNFSGAKEIYVKVSKNKLDITTVVELENGETLEVTSNDLNLEYSTERYIIKEKFEEMHTSIKKSFDELSRNNTGAEIKKELEKTVEEIKTNLTVNVDLLNEILDVKAVDEYLYNHSLNVAVISNLIGKWTGLSQADLDTLVLAGLVHDIGKLKVDQKVLYKPGKLTENEFSEMKKHPAYSHKMLVEMGYTDQKMLKAVTLHHEKEDGTGYPLGISGDRIPIHAKILAVADIFDAMTSNRVYKQRVSPFKVLEMFQNQTFGKLDYGIIMTFIKKFTEYYVGSEVMLSNGVKAKIVSLNTYELTKPLLITNEGKFIDISKNREIQILDFENQTVE